MSYQNNQCDFSSNEQPDTPSIPTEAYSAVQLLTTATATAATVSKEAAIALLIINLKIKSFLGDKIKFIVVDVGKRRFNPSSVFDTIVYKYTNDCCIGIASGITFYEEVEYEEMKLINEMKLGYKRSIGTIVFIKI
ncbi:15394_t:CDS:2 [Entrophospora sp. SA101]|nr:15394_t:CDS:2 [Entrophospora sp. SA101]